LVHYQKKLKEKYETRQGMLQILEIRLEKAFQMTSNGHLNKRMKKGEKEKGEKMVVSCTAVARSRTGRKMLPIGQQYYEAP
jgi:hypothetical protein